LDKLSAYILTKNSERYLSEILKQVAQIADELIIVDSGSTDGTKQIAGGYSAKFIFRQFDNFKNQRNFAAQSCTNDMVLFLDSDEIPDSEFIDSLQRLKEKGFKAEAYDVKREWYVLNKKVHCIYPIVSPDYPIRLYNRKAVSFNESSNFVHETPHGYSSRETVGGCIQHLTFHSKEEMTMKLEQYSSIAAHDLLNRKKQISGFKIFGSPLAAFCKWYFIKGGYKDGALGFMLGQYAFNYTKQKYLKAKKLLQ
jgi:glycosyltransferase involved in cell wall biosynthesis